MSEPSSQKLLLVMTCVFGVALVIISYGRRQNDGFKRPSFQPNSISAGRPVEEFPRSASTSQQMVPANRQNHQAWRSTPTPVKPQRQASWPSQTVVEDYFDSTPLESRLPSRVRAQHPISQRYQQTRQQLTQNQSPRKQNWQAPRQLADRGFVQQAAAITPVDDSVSDRLLNSLESSFPQPDVSTRQQNDFIDASRLPTNHSTTARSEKPLDTAPTARQRILVEPTTDALTSNSSQSVLELELTAPPTDTTTNTTPIRVDKRVRKVNWAEIEMASPPEAKTVHRPLKQLNLPLQQTTPQVESKAREQVHYGQSLARRRAFFAAREELIRALLLIASSHHTDAGSHAYPESLAQALVALDESSDLMNFSGDTNSPQLQQILRSHQTQLITPQDIPTITPMQAISIYSSFAQNKIEQAIGMSVAGSEALHALGKLESIAPETSMKQARTNQTKTLVFYRAAININPSNTICANDLGVLLYQIGRLQESEFAFQSSLKSAQSQLTWNNLSMVHSQLAATAGMEEDRDRQHALANAAAQQARRFSNSASQGQPNNGQWATTTEFQNNAAFPNVVLQNATNRPAVNSPQPGVSNSAKLKQKLKDWF